MTKFAASRPYADPEAAARQLVQLASSRFGTGYPYREDQRAVSLHDEGQRLRVRSWYQVCRPARLARTPREWDICALEIGEAADSELIKALRVILCRRYHLNSHASAGQLCAARPTPQQKDVRLRISWPELERLCRSGNRSRKLREQHRLDRPRTQHNALPCPRIC